MDVTSSQDERSPGPELNKPQDEDCSEMELQLRLEDSSDDKEDENDAVVDDKVEDKVEDDVREGEDEKRDQDRTALTPEKLQDSDDELEKINTNKTDENKQEETQEPCEEAMEESIPRETKDDTSTYNDPLETDVSSPTHETVSTQSETPQTSSQPHRLKLLEGSLPQLKKLTPRLSGNAANSFIDLDDDDDNEDQAEFATPCNPGINSLMKRFVKHTAKSTPRQRKEVKLRLVFIFVEADVHVTSNEN